MRSRVHWPAIALLAQAAVSPLAEASVGKNVVVDLSVPAAAEALTDAAIFDESVLFSPNFAVNQNDPALGDLFDPQTHQSNLCFPTSLAEALIDIFGYHAPKFDRLPLAGLTPDHGAVDPNALVRQLAGLCHTGATSGTDSRDALRCTTSILAQAGYGVGGTQLVSPFYVDLSLPIESRDVTILDIRQALRAGHPIILEVGWYVFEPATKTWLRKDGHFFSAFGYDYNQSWGEDQIQLKVVNPELSYDASRAYALWDTITVARPAPQPGVVYPAHRPYYVSGTGFGGLTERGFLGEMLTIAPSPNP